MDYGWSSIDFISPDWENNVGGDAPNYGNDTRATTHNGPAGAVYGSGIAGTAGNPAMAPGLNTSVPNGTGAMLLVTAPITLSPTGSVAATASAVVINNYGYTYTATTVSDPAGAVAGSQRDLVFTVPAGQNFKITGTNVALGTLTYNVIGYV